MSEPKKYPPKTSIVRSKLKPRTVTAKGTKYTVTLYGLKKEEFLKFCRALKEYGVENLEYINFEVWDKIGNSDDTPDTPDTSDDLPF